MAETVLNANALSDVYFVSIPYESSIRDDIPAMLAKAINDGKFQSGKLFLGFINPSGQGCMIGKIYLSGGKWYGNVHVIISDANNGVYKCDDGVFTKV